MSVDRSDILMMTSKHTKPYHAKLHKRGGSNSSTAGSFQVNTSQPYLATCYSAGEERFLDMDTSASVALSNSNRLKPYLRRSSKSDQGKLDLGKSISENEKLAGLGIEQLQGSTPSIVADPSFASNGRRSAHTRTTSVGSQISNSSSTYRPNQPFAHPMKQMPRPYTPPTMYFGDPDYNDEVGETFDTVEEDFRRKDNNANFRQRRSISISSSVQNHPTPLSQSHTPSDLDHVLKPAGGPNTSALSLKSTRSSSQHRPSRPRRDTDQSTDYQPTPSSRTSLDKAFSLVSRRSELGWTGTELQSQDERIREARRKFEEKEASKDRKEEQKRERQRRRSEVSSDDAGKARQTSIATIMADGRHHSVQDDGRWKLHSQPHAATEASVDKKTTNQSRAMPREPKFERTKRPQKNRADAGGWSRFSNWAKSTVMHCGKA